MAPESRDDFLSVASHELRTPLTPLNLQIQSLVRKLDQLALDATPREWLERRIASMARQSARLERLVNELLDPSRIVGGQLDLELAAVDFADVVRTVTQAEVSSGAIERSACQVTVRAEGAIVGRWDRHRLSQVVENLLSNALKFGARRPVEIAVELAGGAAILTVRDEGIGISPEDQERIFGRFERAVSIRNYGGLGVGLFVVRRIVEALGGRVQVRSAPGLGACFTVTIPLAGPADPLFPTLGQALGASARPESRN